MGRSGLPRKAVLLLAALGVLLAGAAYCALALNGIGIACPFYQLTGLQCPGCGNSRAVLALLRLDLSAALGYNPLFPLEAFYLGWVLFHCGRNYLKGKAFSYRPPLPLLDGCILAAVVLWWILRNLL